MRNKEFVSIIVPCYNQALFLDDALRSVADQTHQNWECLIVDDGSPDDSEEIAKRWCSLDKRFSYIKKPNGGVSSARNTGIEAAKGDFVLPLDGDDKISANYVEGCLEVFERNPDTKVVYGKAQLFGAQRGEWPLPDFTYEKLLTRNLIFCTAMFRKRDWAAAGGYDEQMTHGLEDWDFWLRVIREGDKVIRENAIVFYYRIKQSSRNADLYKNQHFIDETYTYLYDKHQTKMKRVVGNPLLLYVEKEELEKQVKQLSAREIHKEITLGDIVRKFKYAIRKRMVLGKEAAVANTSAQPSQPGSKLGLIKNKVKANIGNNRSLKEIVLSALFYLSKKGIHKLKNILRFVVRKIYVWVETKHVVILNSKEESLIYAREPYKYWRSKHEVKERDYDTIRKHAATFNPAPFFTIIMYAGQIDENIKRSLVSVCGQVYSNAKLVIATSSETHRELVKKMLRDQESCTLPVEVVLAHQVAAAVTYGGDAHFMMNLNQGDMLTPDALYRFAYQALLDPEAGIIYADEDTTDCSGAFYAPHFKPDWCPDGFLSYNYIGHAVVINAALLQQLNDWSIKWEAGALYDTLLEAGERTTQVAHVARIVYRAVEKKTDAQQLQSGYERDREALSAALKRRGEEGEVLHSEIVQGVYIPRYKLKAEAKVSIIIPTKDKIDILKTCIDSIVERSTYKNFEIILIDNNSSTPEFFEQVKKWEQALPGVFRCVRTEAPFNFAYLMNFGATYCTGEYYVLLNNDTEVITPDWMERMMEQAQRSAIGVVGAKLLYPDNTIQHAGVVIGMSGLVDHVFVGTPRYGQSYQHAIHRVMNYSALTAACLMVSKQKFDEVNGFNEQFEVEYNDIDFCLRLKSAGYNHVYLPHVELYHHESISRGHPFATPASYQRHLREYDLMKKTWQKFIDYDPCYNPNLSLRDRNVSVAY